MRTRVLRFWSPLLCLGAVSAVPSMGACDGLWGAGPHFEVYTTGDYEGGAASLSSMVVWSPFGPVNQPGWRVRLDSLTDVYGSNNSGIFSNGFLPGGMSGLVDAMVGYQFNYNSLWLKLYAGAVYHDQTFIYSEIGAVAGNKSWGIAAALESWWRPAERVWTAIDVSWADTVGSLYAKAGYEVHRGDSGFVVSVGGETTIAGADARVFKEGKDLGLINDYLRGGGLLNFRYGSHELTLSGGLSEGSNEAAWHPYATLSYGKKF